MSNFDQQLDNSTRILIAHAVKLAENPPVEHEYTGVPYASMRPASRYAGFGGILIDRANSSFLAMQAQEPTAKYDRIVGAFDTGIDISAHFIRLASGLLRTAEPEITMIETTDVLKKSFANFGGKLMRTDVERAEQVETAHGLSSISMSASMDELELRDGQVRFNKRAEDYLEAGEGRCPFGPERMEPVFHAMVDAAAQIDWLLPLDFERIEA